MRLRRAVPGGWFSRVGDAVGSGGSCKRGMMVAEDDGEGMVGRQGERGRRLASGRQPFCGTATSGSLLFPPPPLPPPSPPPPPPPPLPTPAAAAASLLRLSTLSPHRLLLRTIAISSSFLRSPLFFLLLTVSSLYSKSQYFRPFFPSHRLERASITSCDLCQSPLCLSI